MAGLLTFIAFPLLVTAFLWPVDKPPSIRAIVNLAKLCPFYECCHPNDGTGYIRYNNGTESLLEDLQTKVYGQPLMIGPIYKAVKAHMINENPRRPLVMYFSGWTGTGKTHVAKLIAKNLYKEGMNSKYVKYISSSYHFPIKIEGHKEIMSNRLKLRDMIRETVKQCERSLIILDELDKLPSGVVDILQPLVDYVDETDGVRYNKAIFIFLSNTGATSLNQLAYRMYMEGKERKDLSSKDLEDILIKESYNEPGGLGKSSIIKRYSIGVFVPFLPLGRQHVRRCIIDEIDLQGETLTQQYRESIIDTILDEIAYFPEETQIYSKSGCKGVHDKVINYIGPQILYDDGWKRKDNARSQDEKYLMLKVRNEL